MKDDIIDEEKRFVQYFYIARIGVSERKDISLNEMPNHCNSLCAVVHLVFLLRYYVHIHQDILPSYSHRKRFNFLF